MEPTATHCKGRRRPAHHAMGDAIRGSQGSGQSQKRRHGEFGTKHTRQAETLYSHFFIYLAEAEKSPLKASLERLEIQQDRWLYILAAPFHQDAARLERWAEEALQGSKKLEAMARHTSTDDFEKQILISLDE